MQGTIKIEKESPEESEAIKDKTVLSNEIIETQTGEELDHINLIYDQKIKILVNLMNCDNKIQAEEIEFIQQIIDALPLNEKKDISNYINSTERFKIDYTPFIDNVDETVALLMDLIGLAKRDGEFHPAEKIYIKKVGQKLLLPDNQIDELISLKPEKKAE